MANLKRIVAACGDRPVFIVSPIFRFTLSLCCATAGHMTNFQDPDFIKTLLKDLGRVRSLLKSILPGNTIIDRMELVCGQGYNLEKAVAAARSAWVSDPVHPSNHSFAKMALNLLEAMAPSGILPRGGGSSGRKRKRGESEQAANSGGKGSGGRSRARNWSDQRRGGGYQQYYPMHHNQQYHHAAPRGRGGHHSGGYGGGYGRGYGGGGGGPCGRGGRWN
jgi:hypothetical protein